MMPGPKVVEVLFKDEDEVNGETIGPVWLRYNDDTLKPYGRVWVSLRRAYEIADEYGVELVQT
jgi:hypothetical protein